MVFQKYAMLRPQAATAIQIAIDSRPATCALAGIATPGESLTTLRFTPNSKTARLTRPAAIRASLI
jgi:hypothetical protein